MAGRRLPNPAFLLSAALLVLAAGASARPPFSPESDADATNAASALPRDPLPSPAAAQQRRSLQGKCCVQGWLPPGVGLSTRGVPTA